MTSHLSTHAASTPPSKPVICHTGGRQADAVLACAREALGDGWEVRAARHLSLGRTSSAKPAAVMIESDPGDLAAAALGYEENLAAHLVAARGRLVTVTSPDEHRTLRQLASALEQLQAGLLAVPADVDDCGRGHCGA